MLFPATDDWAFNPDNTVDYTTAELRVMNNAARILLGTLPLGWDADTWRTTVNHAVLAAWLPDISPPELVKRAARFLVVEG